MPFPIALLPAIIGAASALTQSIRNRSAAKQQQKHNLELAQFQADANEDYLDKQLEYNSPENQMLRFQKAGLNPHLIYGQGNPGNQASPLSFPDIRPADFQSGPQAFSADFNRSMLTMSQVQAQNAKTVQTYALTEVNKLQARVLEANPLLNNDGFKAIIDGLKATAAVKEQTGKQMQLDFQMSEVTYQHRANKIFQEVENLEKQFDLMKLDEKIKAEVLQSKQFQNAILEIQKKFIADGDIGPQQILQFIMLLLTKAM